MEIFFFEFRGHFMDNFCRIIEISLAFSCHMEGITYKTKLKLDKEVGGGDLSQLCTITYLLAYRYA